MDYVELHSRSAFSFLRGASSPEQLAEVARSSGMPAMALCDRDGVYGAPRFFAAAKENNIRAIIGSELTMEDGSVLPVLVETRAGYQNLCRLLTRAHLRAAKGESKVRWDELPEFASGLVALTGDDEGTARARTPTRCPQRSRKRASCDSKIFSGAGNLFVELQRHRVRGEDHIIHCLLSLAATHRLPLLATNGPLYAKPYGREVLDVFTCIRNHTHLDAAGKLLARNSECHVKDVEAMQRLFADLPGAIENTCILADRLRFSLENLGYEFPKYPLPAGESPDSFLRTQTFLGARNRYGDTLSDKVRAQLNHELAIIEKLGFAGYFLITWDLVQFCRENNIMIQGRGSAANSAVCYCLGITASIRSAATSCSNGSSARAAKAGPTSTSICPAATAASASSRKSIAVTANTARP
jgi:error-prone DNA polymerase